MAKGYSARKGFSGGAGMMQQQAQMQQKLLKMQQEMAKAQEEVESRQFTASVGGGAVTAAVTGKKELVKFLMDRRLQRRDMPTEAYAYVGRAKDTKAKETEEDAKHDA